MIYPDGSTSAIAQVIPVDPRHRGQCGKVCFGSYSAADREVKRMKRLGKAQSYRGYLEPYLCKPCRAWHVGHSHWES